MNSTHVVTENRIKFDDTGKELESKDSRIGPSIVPVEGPPGVGKTVAAKIFAANSNAVYIPPLNIISPGALLREITFELNKVKPYRIADCLEVIGNEMSKLRRLIIIDEADLLEMKVLEMLRNINERYSCPIILIGEEGFINKIAQRRRLLSRIRRRLEFQPVGQPDIVLFFRKALGADIASNPKITDLIHKHCKGDWRPVLTVALKIEKALKASGLKEIPLKLVEDIIEKEGGKNRA